MAFGDQNAFIVHGLLQVAVPMWIDRWRGRSFDDRRARVDWLIRDNSAPVSTWNPTTRTYDETPGPAAADAKGNRAVPRDAGPFAAGNVEALMFRDPKKGKSAEAFNGLAEALAILAFQPGGVRFMGTGWCAEHAPIGFDAAHGRACAGCHERALELFIEGWDR